MMFFRRLVGGPLYSNSYIVYQGNKGLIIDAGVDPHKIYSSIDELNVEIELIVLTHGHFDHVFYADELSKNPNVKVYMHESDLEIMRYSATLGEYLYGENFQEPRNLITLRNTHELNFNNIKIKILHTPGHSPGSICTIIDNLLFTGDTLLR
ncbi:MAG: MBL fold metallo-hydrolase, partial [Desulfurococcaceae archaeon]